MADEIYYRLREKIDGYSFGMAATKSGVEIRLLKKLFTEEEAEMYLNLTEDLQTAEEIANKINRDPKEVEALLRRMTEKGHTFPRFPQKEGEPFYVAAAPYVHGLIEHQLHRTDKELVDLINEHGREGNFSKPFNGLRIVPVQASVDKTLQISNYDDVEAIIRKKERIAVADCVCNDIGRVGGLACDQPREVCFMFDFYAQYYVDKGVGRWVTAEEALERLKECAQAGLVPQFSSTENPEALCNCCPDCCAGLGMLKQQPNPGLMAQSNHFAAIKEELCSGCEICIDRCPMDAISMGDLAAQINRDKCIGCGLCVITCPEEALSLKAKPEEQRFTPPEKGVFMRSSKEMESRIKS